MVYPALLPTIKTYDKLPISISRELSSKIRQFQNHCFHTTQLTVDTVSSVVSSIMIWHICQLQLGWHPVAAVQYSSSFVMSELYCIPCLSNQNSISSFLALPVGLYIVVRCIVDHNNWFGLQIWNELLLQPFLITRVVHVVMPISTFEPDRTTTHYFSY